MGQVSSIRIVKPAFAVMLSVLLAVGAPLDGARAFASDESTGGGSASELINEPAESETLPSDTTSQYVETVKLPEASSDQQSADVSKETPVSQDESTTTTNPTQAEGDVPLTQDEPKAVVGEVRSEGLVYRVLPDGVSVALVGWYGTAPEGDVLVPASVTSGEDSYDVTCIGEDGQSICVFADSKVTTLTLPSSVQEIIEGALSGCPTLTRIEVSSKNESFASFDGMLFSKDLSSLLTVPEGKEGAAHIPDQTTSVPASAFSQAPGLQSVEVGEGSVTFASRNGVLYSLDLATLIACPPGAGQAAVISAEVERIGEQAFAGCSLTSITALGFVSEIASDAFTDEVKANALVALPAGEDYESRKAVWETVGFTHFAEPAKPGDTSEPTVPENDQQASGLAYTLLDDYTLSVSWQGNDDPACDLEIPATAEVGGVSYQVSTIASGAFANRGSLASVKLPSTITTLGDAAFAGCSNLQTIALPEGLRIIGDRAFEATLLSDVWLPASITSLGARTFAGCSSLTRVVAQSTPQVASDALAECAGVNVFCPSGSEDSWNVGLPAANNHLAPYGITLPEEPLTLEVDQSASLFNSDSLKAPEPIEVAYAYAAKPVSIDADGTATGKAPGTSEVIVTLTLDNKELVRATRTVEVKAAQVDLSSQEDSTAEDNAASSDSQATTVDAALLEPRLSSRGVEVLSGTVSLLAAEVRVFDYEYQGHKLRYQVTPNADGSMPDYCSVIGRSYSVADLEGDLVIPEQAIDAENGNAAYKVQSIATYALSETKITSVSFPSTLANLGSGCFMYCPDLKSVFIPKTVTWMGFNPFLGCSSLADLRLDEENRKFSMLDGVIYDKAKTTLIGGTPGSVVGQIDIPDTVTTVKVNAFTKCSQMTGLSIPRSVTDFGQGYNLLSDLEKLKTITIDPENVDYAVEDGLLYKKENGVPVTLIGGSPASTPDVPIIPATVTKIDKGSFQKKENVTSAIVPPAVNDVGSYLFRGCNNLGYAAFLNAQSVAFDSSLFDSCPSLRELLMVTGAPVFKNTESSTPHTQFNGTDTRNITVYCPESAQAAWAEFGVNTVPFATSVPGTIGLPYSLTSVTRQFESSIPSSSVFADQVRLVHTFNAGTSGISADLSDSTGRSVTFTRGSGSGPATLTSRLVYDDGRYGEVILAESTSTVAEAPQTGALPTATNPSNTDEAKASWSLSSDGTLTLCGTDKVGDLGWTQDDAARMTQHWGPLRDYVKRVDTRSLTGAVSMASWFSDMAQLTDVSNLVIPSGVENLSNLLSNSAISTLTEGFALPDGVLKVDGLFAGCPLTTLSVSFASSFARSTSIVSCSSLLEGTTVEVLPEEFGLPVNASDISSLFANSKLAALPSGFTIPGAAKTADSLFQGCAYLVELPEGFRLQEGVASAIQMFDGCVSLVGLPESFGLPSTLSDSTKAAKMFGNCPKLNVLPAGFSLPSGFDLAATPDMFYCYRSKPLWYAGSDAILLGQTTEYWSAQLRTFGSNGEGSVVFNLSSKDSAGFEAWTAALPDQASGRVINPTPPTRTGKIFTLWYTDEACTQRFNFTKRVDEQMTRGADGRYALYGRYADGVDSGALPTTGNVGSATWALSSDGTLYIKGDGTINLDIPDEGIADAAYAWSPYRASIKKVAMQPALKTTLMKNWFCGMEALEDVTQTFVPGGTKNMHKAFFGCTSLKSLPEGFTISSSVEDLTSAFEGCTSLVALPSSFALYEGSLTTITGMFKGCTSLASLPEGFTIPEGVQYLSEAFSGCPSLTKLPDSFSLPTEVLEGTGAFFVDVPAGESRITTFYAGSNPAVLNYDWESQGRTLVTNEGEMGNFGMQRVTFKVQSATADANGAFPWETRSVAWSNKQGIVADPGAPVLYGYTFSGWCTDEECLQPFDFATPLTTETTLYGTWVVAGGKNSQDRTGGELPVVAGSGSAWWRITADGNLRIEGEGNIGNLGWAEGAISAGYWAPYREQVTSIAMAPGIQAEDLSFWFAEMVNLTDVSEVLIPSNAKKLDSLFSGASSLAVVGANFILPEGVQTMSAAFAGCKKLWSLPEGFALPSTVENARWLFGNCYELTKLPGSLTLEGCSLLVQAGSMFVDCIELRALPGGFRIPSNVANAEKMFSGCEKLAFLPEGFSFENPARIENVSRMFYGCLALTSLPSSLKLQALSEASKATWGEMFTASWGSTLSTYYAGAVSDMPDVSWWSAQYRELSTTAPSGKAFVNFMLPNAQTGDYELWARQLADVGSPFTEAPSAPNRENATYMGWYVDKACTQKYNFKETIIPAEGVTLYAKYYGHSGELPTTDGQNNASWELTADGTLRIDCKAGATIGDFGWTDDTFTLIHWGPIRSRVKRVEMAPTVQVDKSMDMWFTSFVNMKSVEGIFIPSGVQSIAGLFLSCHSLTSLDGLVIPSEVTDANRLLANCRSLEALPSSFVLPDGITNASGMFDGCISLKAFPDSFALPKQLKNASSMFAHCTVLERLSSSMLLPDGVKDLNSLFYESTGLKGLPEGFTIPQSVTDCSYMFVGCSMLESLPPSFTFAENAQVTTVDSMFGRCASLKGVPEGFSIPASVTSARSVFYACTSLKSLPSSFRIGGGSQPLDLTYMFMSCTSLTSLPEGFALPARVSCLHQTFAFCPALTTLPGSLDLSSLTNATNIETAFLISGTTPVVTYYAGSDVSKLLPAGVSGDAATYWAKYKRTLTWSGEGSAALPSGVYKVTFKLQKPDEAAASEWMTVLTDATGRVSAPTEPTLFGYAFSGWKVKDASGTSQDFDFSQAVTADTVLEGSYTLITKVDVPLQAKVEVDASGNVTPASAEFVSRTPVALNVTQVMAEEAPGTAQLFPNASEWARVSTLVGLGSSSFRVSIGAGPQALSGGTLGAASALETAKLPVTLSLDLNGAQLNYQPGEDITSFAKLTWTVEAA